MFDFLHIFFLDSKKKHLAIQKTGFWSKNLLNYKNHKTMSQLLVLISGLAGVDSSKILLVTSRFGPETFLKRWAVVIACLAPLFLLLI